MDIENSHDHHDHPAATGQPKLEFKVNGKAYFVDGERPNGRKLLNAAGFKLADQHLLILRAGVGARVVSLDETVELGDGQPNNFFAFLGDEIFTFTVERHSFYWGRDSISEPELRDFVEVNEDHVLVHEVDGERPKELGPTDIVCFNYKKVERFKIVKRLVEVFLDNEPKRISAGPYQVAQLAVLLGVEDGYLLNLRITTGLEALKPDRIIVVHAGQHFFSQAPGGGSS